MSKLYLPKTEHLRRDSANSEVQSFNIEDQLSPNLWETTYGVYDRGLQQRKLDELEILLRDRVDDKATFDEDMLATRQFVGGAFDLYEGKGGKAEDGEYAFVVPTRMTRGNPDYAQEAIEHFPVLKYTDAATRQRMVAGMCPFVIDKYGPNGDLDPSRQGFMVFAPLFGDMMHDLADDPGKLAATANKVINDTARFCRDRLGTSVIGLGAILPRLTDYGRSIDVKGLYTTTGHGGTIDLFAQGFQDAVEQKVPKDYIGNLGIIGAGAIGGPTADVIAGRGLVDQIELSDNRPDRLEAVVQALTKAHPGVRIKGSLDNRKVVERNAAILSAVTTTFDLSAPEWQGINLEGKYFGDDSQPGCFDPMQVEALGGVLAWVMGHDGTHDQALTLRNFSYGDTGPASRSDVWGCQAEVAAIALTRQYDFAINAEVTPKDANNIGDLMKEVGIGPARMQRMGRYVALGLAA